MFWRITTVLLTLILATVVLSTSLFQAVSIRYAFSQEPALSQSSNTVEIDYKLSFPGRVLPGSLLWPIKATRDKVWMLLTTDPGKKAELNLLFADKRIWGAKILFEKEEFETGMSTLAKAEKYLEEAARLSARNKSKGLEVSEFSERLAKASLKHWQTVGEILNLAPEDARPEIIKIQNYSIESYKSARDSLQSLGLTAPINPFEANQ